MCKARDKQLSYFQIDRQEGQWLRVDLGVDLILRRAIGNASLRQLAVLGTLGNNAVLLHRHTLKRVELTVCNALIAEARDFFSLNEDTSNDWPSWCFAYTVANFDGTNSGVHGGKKHHTCSVGADCDEASLSIFAGGVTMPSGDVEAVWRILMRQLSQVLVVIYSLIIYCHQSSSQLRMCFK